MINTVLEMFNVVLELDLISLESQILSVGVRLVFIDVGNIFSKNVLLIYVFDLLIPLPLQRISLLYMI